ncbi:hypothetical protein IGI04_035399 [Brassica rapa subsp. trilocularis]|uniref:Uncharacterized protein n=1 Tax=Brassica rapa subsp. trilocularis TaxID=1813537 RepID=A0ABQ7LBF9_BRACM|nr:hypothetical protein IGI04_035399 [Brassica rapa subsp. trilocularis]
MNKVQTSLHRREEDADDTLTLILDALSRIQRTCLRSLMRFDGNTPEYSPYLKQETEHTGYEEGEAIDDIPSNRQESCRRGLTEARPPHSHRTSRGKREQIAKRKRRGDGLRRPRAPPPVAGANRDRGSWRLEDKSTEDIIIGEQASWIHGSFDGGNGFGGEW